MANGFEAAAAAFSDEALGQMIAHGASGEMALGNDAAATFNLGSGLSKWFTAVGGGGRQHIAIWGDSNVQHEPANTYRWAQQLRTDLLSFTGIAQGGDGFRNLGLAEWAKVGTWVDHSTDVNLSGTAADIGPYGKAFSGNVNTAVYTWTKPTMAAYDRFELYTMDDDLLSQQGEYSVDGGAFTGTAFNFAPTTGSRLEKQAIVAAPATTLRFRPVGNGFPTYFVGAAFYQGTTGLVVHNLSLGGTMITDQVGPRSANRLAIMDDLQPKLTIVWTGTNEFLNFNVDGFGARKQMTLEEFYANYKRVVQKARQYGDCLIIYPQGNQITGNQLTQTPMPRQQADFERVARRLAYEQDCGFISMHSLWGPWERHNARGFAFDAQHMSTTGHPAAFKFISRAIRRVS